MEMASSPAGPPRSDRDPRASLQNLLSDPTPPPASPRPEEKTTATAAANSSAAPPAQEGPSAQDTPAPESAPQAAPQNDVAMTTTTRRNAGGTVSSVYCGNRIKYLKKEDGIPFWRKDIQYAFLKMVFEDDKRVFTRFSDGDPNHTFAEVYIDAMAKSGKCSQILRDKLLSDRWEELGRSEPVAPNGHSPAIDMAMVCLLVNVGRMNTTINFFPEMRARVRTFHSIPCLQANAGPMAYKQLQDGPRLKSILKGALEDVPQPATIPAIYDTPRPRTNPVSLVFLFANYAPKISDLHFPPPRDFFDIFMRETLTSRSRATAFLSLMWWYMESDFTAADVKNNPYGSSESDDPERPFKIPLLDVLSEEEAAKENEDPEEEIEFGEKKRKEREIILASDEPPSMGSKRGKGARESRQSNASLIAQADLDSSQIEDRAHDMNQSPYLVKYEDGTHSPPLPGRHAHLGRHESDKSHEHSTRGERGERRPRGRRLLPPLKSTPSQKDSSPAPYEYRPKPILAPAVGSQYAHESPYNQSHLLVPNGGVGDHSIVPPSHHPVYDQLRYEKASENVNQQLKILQKAKRREKRRRGVFADAWIKARTLPDGFDSEEDEDLRMGGIHDIRGHDQAVIALRVHDSTDIRQINWNTVDKGRDFGNMARAYRKLSKRFKKLDAAERARDTDVEVRKLAKTESQSSDSSRRQQRQRPYEDIPRISDQKRQVSSTFPLPPPPEHARSPLQQLPLQPPSRHGGVGSSMQNYPALHHHHHHHHRQSSDDNTSHSPRSAHTSVSTSRTTASGPGSSQPIKRRRRRRDHSDKIPSDPTSLERQTDGTYDRRPPTSSSSTGAAQKDASTTKDPRDVKEENQKEKDKSFSWVPKGRKRKDSDANRDVSSLRPGEMGIPTTVFFSDKKIAEQSVASSNGSGNTAAAGGGAGSPMTTPTGRRRRATGASASNLTPTPGRHASGRGGVGAGERDGDEVVDVDELNTGADRDAMQVDSEKKERGGVDVVMIDG